ncbi:MAG: alpha-amylase family glycosyl hydrolase [Brevinematia bacterium]
MKRKLLLAISIVSLFLLIFLGCQRMPTIETLVLEKLQASQESTQNMDLQRPSAEIVSPKNYGIVLQTFPVLVLASDDRDIEKVVVITPYQILEVPSGELSITKSPQGFVYTTVLRSIDIPSGGTNEIKVFAIDSNGNVSTTNSLKVIVDVSNPTISIVGYENTSVRFSSTNFQLTLSAEDDTVVDGLFLAINTNAYSEVARGKTFSTNLVFNNNSTNILRVYSKDTVGRISEIREITIIADSSLPYITIEQPRNYAWLNTSNVIISGNVSVSGGSSLSKIYLKLGDGAWEEVPNPQLVWVAQKVIPVESSNIIIKAKAVDSSGRESFEASVIVGIDWTRPTVSILHPQNNSTVTQDNVTVSGNASDALSGLKVVQVKVNDGGYVNAFGLENWSQVVSSLTNGVNTIYARVVDVAGNISEVSIAVVKSVPSGGGGGSGGAGGTVTFPGDGPEDPRDWRVYFVMTDRFVDGYSGNNNIYGDEYRTPNNDSDEALRYYNGGDFKGLINNLDYIKEMGFNAIWITPVVKQPEGRYVNSSQTYDAAGYHGYWGFDFDSIDPHLESPGATFDDLIREAHNRGIKVILDIVPNHGHGGDAHPSVRWYADRLKVKFDGQWWEYNPTTDPYKNNPNVDGIWENSPGFFNYRGDYKLLDLLDFNECDPRTRQHMFNVYKKFIDRGVDGFRLDTVAYMRKQWWGLFADTMWEYAVSKGKPWFWIVGEAWVATRQEALSYSTYSTRGVLSLLDLHGSCMDFPGQAKGVFAGSSGFEQMANIMASDYSGGIDPTFLGTFVDNHDKPRFPGGYADSGSMVRMWKNALNWYFLARGIPIVYYGTEFEGTHDSINDYGAGEPKNRRFVGQDRINRLKANPGNYPIYRHLRMLNRLREAEISLRRGSQVNIHLQGDLAVFKREYVSSVSYVVINKSSSSASYSLSLPNGQYKLLTPSGDSIVTNNVLVSSGNYNVNVAGDSFAVLVYTYPDPANSVTISGTYTASMSRVVGNLWRTTINVSSTGSVNIRFNAVFGNTTKHYGDNDEVGTFLPVSGTAVETSSDPITFNAPVVGPYQVEFNDATLSYTIKYVGTTPITTIVCRSFVGGANFVSICGSYSPPTSASDTNNHVPGMTWWDSGPATLMSYVGTDSNGRNIWVWTTTSVLSGKKIEFKFRRNGVDWTPGANYNVTGGQSVDITYDWGLTSSQGAPNLNDTTPPTVAITYPAQNQVILNQTNITVYGTASDDKSGVKEVLISVNNSPFVLANGTTTWSYTTNLPMNTSNSVRVFAKDVSNNFSVTNQVNFVITNIPSASVVVKYFNNLWSSVNIHYNAGGSWTTPPGEAMSSEGNGWWSKTINVSSETYEFVFNNGSQWDNNISRDYISKLSLGTLVHVSNRVVNVGTLYTGTAPVNVTIRYYRPGWSVVKIHYDNGSGWTTPPGVDMESEGNGWWKKTISVVGSNYQFVFNNGSGVWDNNNGQDYKANIGFTNVIIRGQK